MPEWPNGAVCKTVIRGFKSLSSLNLNTASVGCGYGGIDRHASFRLLCRKAYRFDSCYPHNLGEMAE